MARSDLLLSLVRAGTTGDQKLFRRVTEALIADERDKRHEVLAERLDAELQKSTALVRSEPEPNRINGHNGVPGQNARDLVIERVPQRALHTLILANEVLQPLRELIEEQQRVDVLRSYDLEPRHRILLTGPPGNGKTSIAEAVAHDLMVPLLSVRYDALIGSYLGETAGRLRRLFEHIRSRPSVIFFDEFDTIGKERGDTHESGEIKRVVSSLLLQIDDLPSHVVVVTATNHPELLDRAVWRRFQLRLKLDVPTQEQTIRLIESLQKQLSIPLGYAPRTFAGKLKGGSFAEIEEFLLDLARRQILGGPDANPQALARNQFVQWNGRVHPASPAKGKKR